MTSSGSLLYWRIQNVRNRGLSWLFAVVAAFIALYVYLFPGLLSLGGISKFTQSWFPLALVSMAQAVLMLAGGISLSIGATVSLGGVIAATLLAGPLGIAGGTALVLLVGAVTGLASGWVVVRLQLPAIVVTLAASFIIAGWALLIMPRPGGAVPAWFSDLLAGDTPVALGLLVLVVRLWKLYLATPLGLSLYAAGENPVGAYRSGAPVDRSRIAAYGLSGLMCAAAGLFVAAQTGAGDPSGVLGSFLRPNIQPFAQYGWLKLDLFSGDGGHQLLGGVTPALVDVAFNGLPATGYMAYNVINTQAQPGLLANYGGLFRHRASRSCVGADPACS